MSPLFGTAAVFDLEQALLQLNAIHRALPKPLLLQFLSLLKSCSVLAYLLPLPVCAALAAELAAIAPHDFSAFSGRWILSRSRNFMRALCNWDLLFPIEQPTIVAISLCS